MSTYLLKLAQYRPATLSVSPEARELINTTATFGLWGVALVIPFIITFA